MKVEKDKFDSLLARLLQQKPEKTSALKSTKRGGTIIPPKPSLPAKP